MLFNTIIFQQVEYNIKDMSPKFKKPGVYIEEIPSGTYTISSASTAVTAFVAEATRGPRTKAIEISSISDFESQFGRGSILHTSVFLFFANGGKRAVIVRQRDDSLKAFYQALNALDEIEDLNLLCLPRNLPLEPDKIQKAVHYCENRRIFLILDASPVWDSPADVANDLRQWSTNSRNAALYFPRLRGRSTENLPGCGAIAGVYARTDDQVGVWKSPAGMDAVLARVNGISLATDDAMIQTLTKMSVNCIKEDLNHGPLLWGARTLAGNDNEWRYIAVRRTALYIENSIYNSTKWTVFETNDSTLWQKLKSSIEAFMHAHFRLGAFQGAKPDEAYFIHCGTSTMSPQDILAGRVILKLGFAPVKPVEFVILTIQLKAVTP